MVVIVSFILKNGLHGKTVPKEKYFSKQLQFNAMFLKILPAQHD